LHRISIELTTGKSRTREYTRPLWKTSNRKKQRAWIAATSLGLSIGLAIGAALVDYGIDRAELMLMGAVTGLVVGGLQALVLARHGFAGAAWWAAANPPTWALAWLVSSYVISANIDERFTNFGASGTLLYALVTGLLLVWMFRRTEGSR
jgi:hypothetical protein